MPDTLRITFERNTYELTYMAMLRSTAPDFFIFYNKEPELLKFAPAQFEITYSGDQYPNWKFPPSFGDRFDNLRVSIILALIDKYPERYMV
jgi:hypothetical protein